ncbi:MAG: hypothetical protein TREMPRED_003559 [Tremellales sp. Tagirdzhanova-0007]|nr:MAG: hypothetical protein TREMPRED_003559 [Tremellales sp. Tagirdzhanova-0007]
MPSRPQLDTPVPSPPQTPRPISHSLDPLSPLSPISPWPPDPLRSETFTSSASDQSHDLPSAKEIYGSISVLLTYLAFIAFLAWSFFPAELLELVGWSWYPAHEWAVVLPSWMMVLVLFSYCVYAGITAFLTPSLDSINLITDRYSAMPRSEEKDGGRRYYWRSADEEVTPEAVDLPLDLVNRVLYPPRRRPVPPRDVSLAL